MEGLIPAVLDQLGSVRGKLRDGQVGERRPPEDAARSAETRAIEAVAGAEEVEQECIDGCRP